MSKENFEKALQFLFPSEGGYVNDSKDFGGPTNMGITQNTYNMYRKNQGLPQKDVKQITKGEAVDLYYKYYWKASGADNITDPNMAVALFDTAVLHGTGQAQQYYKQSGGNIDKFLDIRQKHYDKRVSEDPSQIRFYKGWNNRVNNLRNNIRNGTFETNATKTEQNSNLYGYANPLTGSNHIYTREEIGSMSKEEFAKHEKEIDAQTRAFKGTMPTNKDLEHEAKTGGGVVYVNSYTRTDGTEVKGYYRSKPKI